VPAVNSKAASLAGAEARPRQVGLVSAEDPKMLEDYLRKKEAEDKHMEKALREFEASYSMVEEARSPPRSP
jgi:hypothetical protein